MSEKKDTKPIMWLSCVNLSEQFRLWYLIEGGGGACGKQGSGSKIKFIKRKDCHQGSGQIICMHSCIHAFEKNHANLLKFAEKIKFGQNEIFLKKCDLFSPLSTIRYRGECIFTGYFLHFLTLLFFSCKCEPYIS